MSPKVSHQKKKNIHTQRMSKWNDRKEKVENLSPLTMFGRFGVFWGVEMSDDADAEMSTVEYYKENKSTN